MNVFGIVLINFLLVIFITYVIGDGIVNKYNQPIIIKLVVLAIIMAIISSIINMFGLAIISNNNCNKLNFVTNILIALKYVGTFTLGLCMLYTLSITKYENELLKLLSNLMKTITFNITNAIRNIIGSKYTPGSEQLDPAKFIGMGLFASFGQLFGFVIGYWETIEVSCQYPESSNITENENYSKLLNLYGIKVNRETCNEDNNICVRVPEKLKEDDQVIAKSIAEGELQSRITSEKLPSIDEIHKSQADTKKLGRRLGIRI